MDRCIPTWFGAAVVPVYPLRLHVRISDFSLDLRAPQSEGFTSTDTFPLSDQHIIRTIGTFQFLPMDNLADLSLGVYFSQDYSETDFVTVNVGLHYLFQAYSSMVTETDREKFLHYANICRNNVDTGLSILPLYLPPTTGTITALLCGVSFTKTHELLHLTPSVTHLKSLSLTGFLISDILCSQHLGATLGVDSGH